MCTFMYFMHFLVVLKNILGYVPKTYLTSILFFHKLVIPIIGIDFDFFSIVDAPKYIFFVCFYFPRDSAFAYLVSFSLPNMGKRSEACIC